MRPARLADCSANRLIGSHYVAESFFVRQFVKPTSCIFDKAVMANAVHIHSNILISIDQNAAHLNMIPPPFGFATGHRF